MPATDSSPDLSSAKRAARLDAAPHDRAAHLLVDGVSYSFGDRRVLTGIAFAARPGDRIGLIGENGAGKSTLLRLIAGRTAPDAGAIAFPGTIGLLEQEQACTDDTTMTAVLDDAQRDAREALDELERMGAAIAERPDDAAVAAAYSTALEAAERTDAWSMHARRGDVVTGLGLGGLAASRTVGSLSGGQRLRLALAAVLLEAPELLLLDEPSNHLDDASAAYLERVLADWPGIVVLASHDRALLDAVTTKIIDLDPLPVPAVVLEDAAVTGEPFHDGEEPSRGTYDPGSGFGARVWGVGYSTARKARAAETARWRERYAAEQQELAVLRHEIEVGSREVNKKHESKSESNITKKFYADKDARVTSRKARNARVRLEALERNRVRRPPEALKFEGFAHSAERPRGSAQDDGTAARTEIGAAESGDREHRIVGTPAPLIVDDVSIAGRLAPITFEVEAGEHLLLNGPNGAGKSTLLAILAGELQPARGAVTRDPAFRIGYLPQEVRFDSARDSAAEVYRRAVGIDTAEALPLSATGLIAPRDVDRAIGALSVGQRRRLALAALVADPPDILLLDEPGNHLSLSLVEELESALGRFAGTLVVASHDRYVRERWRGTRLALTSEPSSVPAG